MSTAKLTEAFAKRKVKESEKQKAKSEAPQDLTPFEVKFGKEKIDGWKKQFAGRQLIALSCGGKMAVLRPPTADDLGEYMMAAGTEGISKAVAGTVETLWLDGDFELIDDEELFIGVFMQLNNILEGKKAEFFRF